MFVQSHILILFTLRSIIPGKIPNLTTIFKNVQLCFLLSFWQTVKDLSSCYHGWISKTIINISICRTH